MADFQKLAEEVMAHAKAHYGDKGARFDVIVECYEIAYIARELEADGTENSKQALGWAKFIAGVQYEAQLNQAWDGPESVSSSPVYDPKRDPAYDDGDPPESAAADLWVGPEFADDVSLEERWEHYAFEERNGMGYGSSF